MSTLTQQQQQQQHLQQSMSHPLLAPSMLAMAPACVTPDRATVVSAEAMGSSSNNNMSVVVQQQQSLQMTLPQAPPPSLVVPTPQLLDDLHGILTVLMTRETSYYHASIHGIVRRSDDTSWRPVMVSWMHSVVDTFSLMPQLVPTGLFYLDRYVATGSTCDQLQYPLMAMTCLNLAVKIHETKMFPLDQLVLLLGKSAVGATCQQLRHQQERYTPAEVVQMERILMSQCQWHLHPPTSHEFLLQFGMLLPVHLRSPVVAVAQTHLKHHSLWEHVLHQQTLASLTTTLTTTTMALPPAADVPRPFLPSTLAYAALLLAMEDVNLQVPLAVKQMCCQSLLQVAGLSAHTPRLEEAYNYMVLAGSLQNQLVKRRQQQARQAVPPSMPATTITTAGATTTITTTTTGAPTFGAAGASMSVPPQSSQPQSGSFNDNGMAIASSVVSAAALALQQQQQQPNNVSCLTQQNKNNCADPTSHIVPHSHDIFEEFDEENQMGAVAYDPKQGLQDELSGMTVDKVPPCSYWRSTLSPSSSSGSESASSMPETTSDHQSDAEEEAEEGIMPLPPPDHHQFSQKAEDEDSGTTTSTLSSSSTETIIFYSHTHAGDNGFEVAVAAADMSDALPLKMFETNNVEAIPELQLVLTESLDDDGVEIAMAQCKYSNGTDLEHTLSNMISSPRMVTFQYDFNEEGAL